MANVLNRTTKEYFESVNTPDFPSVDWLINPDLSQVAGLPIKYWKISGDSVVAMSGAEQAAVDAVDLVDYKNLAISTIRQSTKTFVDSAYDTYEVMTLSMLYTQAVKAGLTNRQAYIAQAYTYLKNIVAYQKQATQFVNNAASVAAIRAQAYDLSVANIGANPLVSMAGALAILN
jgi:hypothetical protein